MRDIAPGVAWRTVLWRDFSPPELGMLLPSLQDVQATLAPYLRILSLFCSNDARQRGASCKVGH